MSILEVVDAHFKVLDHIPVGVFIINRDYSVMFWNTCMEKWTGIPRSEISDADFRDFFPVFKEPRYQGRIANVLDGISPTLFSPQLHKDALKSYLPSGESRMQQIMVLPIRFHDGSEACALFVVEDVTELTKQIAALKNVRNELQKANDEMEDRVESRTAELAATNCRLEQEIIERKQAEETKRLAYTELEAKNHELGQMQSQLVQNEKLAAIGQLAAGVAHEMNTPVGFVASNFQTLQNYVGKIKEVLSACSQLSEHAENSEQTELSAEASAVRKLWGERKVDFILEDIEGLFEDSKEGLERVTDIVVNLRDFSRAGLPGSREEYCLNDGIEATLVVARNEIKYHADIQTDFSQIPFVLCNAGQVNQVFLNILLNAAQAIKYQERESRGTITIKTYATETDVVCEMSDDGPGIEPETLSKIFDPFFTTKPAGKGTGLGLSVSYDIIVNKHGGKLYAESKVDEGTTFVISIPIDQKNTSDGGGVKDEKDCSDDLDGERLYEENVSELRGGE